jgi:hypothetical protein
VTCEQQQQQPQQQRQWQPQQDSLCVWCMYVLAYTLAVLWCGSGASYMHAVGTASASTLQACAHGLHPYTTCLTACFCIAGESALRQPILQHSLQQQQQQQQQQL